MLSPRRTIAIALALLALHGVLAVLSASNKSVTFDESMHVAGGMAAWTRDDYRLNPGSGLLPQLWQSIPAAIGGAKFEPERIMPVWQRSEKFSVAGHFVYGSGNDPGSIMRGARTMTVLLSMTLGLVVFLVTRRIFGPMAGLFALGIHAVSPSMLAHGRLATADTISALFFLLGTLGIWSVLHRVTVRTVLLCALAVGGMMLAKMSWPILFITGAGLLCVRLFQNRPMTVAIGNTRELTGRGSQLAVIAGVLIACGIVAWLMIWAAHGFKFSVFGTNATPGARMEREWSFLLEHASASGLLGALHDGHLLPQAWLFGMADTLTGAVRRNAFLLGEHSATGWWWFFPYVVLIKTPVGLLGLVLASFAAVRRQLYACTPLLVFFTLYWVIAITTGLNIGHRHMLPTYPVMFIFAGAAAAWLWQGRGARRWIATAALAAIVIESALVFPHYLSYFNVLIGGPKHGYKHVVDSSIDWGQDIPALRAWAEERQRAGDARPTFVSYFGVHKPTLEGVPEQSLLGGMGFARGIPAVGGGHFAISATNLMALMGEDIDTPLGPVAMRGPWTARQEQLWQSIAPRVMPHLRSDPKSNLQVARNALGPDGARTIKLFKRLRLLRLCAYCRSRTPDAWAGYSIPIFTLTDQEVQQALFGPMPDGS